MYLIDRPDGVHVRWDGRNYSVRRADGREIATFSETRDRSVDTARKNALRWLRRNTKLIEKVSTQP